MVSSISVPAADFSVGSRLSSGFRPIRIVYAAGVTMADADAPAATQPGATAAKPAQRTPTTPAAGSTTESSAVPRGCPFLLAEEGGWRLDLPSRDHRCAAFTPPAPLSPQKQARLCLTATHSTCATYLASLAAREARLGVVAGARVTRWSLARTTSIIEDPGGLRARVATVVLDRRRWPAIPAVLLVTTLFTLALSGFRGDLPTMPVATSSPRAHSATAPTGSGPAAVGPTGEPAGTSAPPAAPSQLPTGAATATPTAAPTHGATTPPPATTAPAATFRTYSVEEGDTLSRIAGRFGTTVAAIVNLNNLANANALTVGQVLLIPA
jgi:LysM repeat protein